MLKRLWVVVSVLWSAFWLAIGLSGTGFFDSGAYISWILMPWILGIIFWIAWRFISAGRRSGTGIQRY